MLEIANRDSETVIVYGDKDDVMNAMNTFESLVMTTSYNNYPAIVVRINNNKKG